MASKICPTCKESFEAKRKDSRFCSRLCYRRDPNVAKVYSKRTSEYQKRHAREPKRRYDKLRHKCSHKNIDIDLTIGYYLHLLKQPCYYCGKPVDKETGVGLDRVNPEGPYSYKNVVTCCGVCNQIKNKHLTSEEMKVAMRAIIDFRKANST